MNGLLELSKDIDKQIKKNEDFAITSMFVGIFIFLCFPLISGSILNVLNIENNDLAVVFLYLIFTLIIIFTFGYLNKKFKDKIFLKIKILLDEDKKYGICFNLSNNAGLSNYINKNYMLFECFNKIKNNEILSIYDYSKLQYSTILKEMTYQIKNYEQEIKEHLEKIKMEERLDEKLEKVKEKTKVLNTKILQHRLLKFVNKVKNCFTKNNPDKNKHKSAKSKVLKL